MLDEDGLMKSRVDCELKHLVKLFVLDGQLSFWVTKELRQFFYVTVIIEKSIVFMP